MSDSNDDPKPSVEGDVRDAHGHIVTTIPNAPPLENVAKSRWERSWPTIACGAGLFSDGYLNGCVMAERAIPSRARRPHTRGSTCKPEFPY